MLAPGMLTLEQLTALSSNGEIDTVLVCFTDLQGRLAGKRFHAPFFCNGAWKETHACNYLLALDIDMETVPGYKAASWERGYGDFTLKPDLKTLRRIPWLAGTALVLADVLDHHTHAPVPHSPRAMLTKQVERIAANGMKALAASELEFFLFERTLRRHHRSRLQGSEIRRALHRGLLDPAVLQGGAVHAGAPQRPRRRRHHRREFEG